MRQSWLNSTAVTVAAAGPGLKRLISPSVSPGPTWARRAFAAVFLPRVDFELAADDDEDFGLHRAFLDDDVAGMAGKKFAVGAEQVAVVFLEMADPTKRGQGGFRQSIGHGTLPVN